MELRSSSDVPFRVVIAGCGEISAFWFRALQTRPDAMIVGLVDLNEAACVSRREEFGLTTAETGTDLPALLEEIRPDIVFDCTVPVARATVVETALRHGCHVLSEKPLAASLAEARRLLGAARTAGRVFAVMQNRRYLRSIRTLRFFLAQGGLGQLTTLDSDFYIGAHFGGFRQQMKHVLLLDMAIHSFDQARFISGADPVSVFCREWNPRGSWYQHGASAVAVFEMSNGLVYTYRGSWCAEGLRTEWECDWRVIGTGGSAKWDGGSSFQAERPELRDAEHPGPPGELIRPGVALPIPDAKWPGEEAHAGCIHHFLDCIRAGREPETICTDNFKSLAMVFGAIESAEQNRPVQIES